MKRQWMMAIAALGCIAPMTAYAQEARVAAVAGQAAPTGTRSIVGSVETRITPDRPYSAETVNESLQQLPDGNKIHRITVTKVYRDTAGRTRREMLNEDGTVRSITISDPVGKVSYTLDPATRTAVKSTRAAVAVGGVAMGGGGAVVSPRVAPGTAVVAGGGSGSGTTQGVATLSRQGGTLVASSPGARETLDPQVIEGLNATGTRTTTTIPAGQVGNAQEITIVSEQWFSDDLQVLVRTKHNDPRSGETIYRLRNVVRGEPDPSLFLLPGDYVVKEGR